MRRDRAAYITVGGGRGAEGGVLQIQSESYSAALIAGSQNGSVPTPEWAERAQRGWSEHCKRVAEEMKMVVARRKGAIFAFLGSAPPMRSRNVVTPGKSLESGRWACSWRCSGSEQGQASEGGQLDRAAVGLDERDAEHLRATAFCTGRLPGFRLRWRRLVT